MSAPRPSAVADAARPRRSSAPRADGPLRPAWSRSGFRVHTVLVYVFLYLPIVVVVVFAFNGTDRVVTNWERLSTASGSSTRSPTRRSRTP